MNIILESGKNFFKKQSPARLITLGFAFVILTGAVLLKAANIRQGRGGGGAGSIRCSPRPVQCV